MTLTEQVYAQAALLSDVDEGQQEALLMLLCRSAVSRLTARLREGITPEDCKADFIAAGALYALAALTEVDPATSAQRVQFGDVSIEPGGSSAASRCLRNQADLIISPYCKEEFCFRGV